MRICIVVVCCSVNIRVYDKPKKSPHIRDCSAHLDLISGRSWAYGFRVCGSRDWGCKVSRTPPGPLIQALWSLIVGIWGIIEGSWGVCGLLEPRGCEFRAQGSGQILKSRACFS